MKLSAIHTLLFPILVSSLTTPVSRTERNVEGVALAKRATCTPASAGKEAVDDVPAIKAAFQSCGNGGTIVIPAGKTYSIRSILDFAGCVGCTFNIEGTLKASNDLTYWNGKRSIFFMTGVKTATIQSLTGKGVLDGNGQATYDKYAADKNYKRPTLHYITGACSNIKIKNLIVKNAPAWIFSVNGASTNVEYSDLTITTASTSNNPAKNTDGFDVGESTYTTLKNIKVSNQDDCVAFKPGANFVTVDTITCTGSHGISVGSLGKTAGTTDTVKNVYVRKANMIDATKAVGIKVYPGGSAHGTVVVSNVTWDDVTCANCGYAAQIESCYAAESDEDCKNNPSKALITGITFKNFKGKTSTKYGVNIANINCPAAGTCDVEFENWSVVPGSGGTPKYLCANIDSTPGIPCSPGASD